MATAQNATTSPLVWLQPELINPAASGLKSKFDVSTTTYQNYDYTRNLPWGYNASVNGKIGKMNSGMGISYQTNNLAGVLDLSSLEDEMVFQTIRINYNYQIKLKNNAKVALGVTYQHDVVHLNRYWYPPTNPNPLLPERLFANKLNFGAAYQGEKLYVGLAFQNAIDFGGRSDYFKDYLNINSYSLQTSYDFKVGNNWKIAPGILYRAYMYPKTESGNSGMGSVVNIFANTTYAQKFTFGLGLITTENSTDMALGTLGYTFYKKLQIQYALGYAIKHLSSSSTVFNHVALKYALN